MTEEHTSELQSHDNLVCLELRRVLLDRKSTRLNSSHTIISYAVFCLKKKTNFARARAPPPPPSAPAPTPHPGPAPPPARRGAAADRGQARGAARGGCGFFFFKGPGEPRLATSPQEGAPGA